MTRSELLRFAFEVSRDEYVRGQGRLALIETKAQLIAVTAGVFITVLVTYGVEKLPLNGPGTGLLAAMAILSLGAALAFSLSASMFMEVRPPPSASVINEKCAKLTNPLGATTQPDPTKAEELISEQAVACALAAQDLSQALAERIRKLRAAQIALLFSLALIIVWLGLPAIGIAIAQFNSGGISHG